MILTDARGLATSATEARSLELYEQALDEGLGIHHDPVATIETALADEPGFVMGHCLAAEMQMLAMEKSSLPDAAKHVALAEALTGAANERERAHIAAGRAWLAGDLERAVEIWETILIEHPRDLLALFAAHMTDFYLGDPVQMRDRVARVLRAWDRGVPGYGFVLGLYAFGLEECADYERAEATAREAVAINPRDTYAIHAAAHVMEMQGRQADGIQWMSERFDDWTGDGFSIHLWWHLALFHLDLGEVDRVLEIYDSGIRKKEAGISLEELDAAAMLWRLQLYGIDVSSRWGELADRWEPSAEDTVYAFNDMHAMMTFAGDHRDEAAGRLLGAAASYVTERGGTNARMTREVGIPVCRALLAFSRADYGAAVDLLLPVRYKTFGFGGSYAQRDVLNQTLIEAALRARRYNLAHALLTERTQLKPSSAINWLAMGRALDGLHDPSGATAARERAAGLLAPGADASALYHAPGAQYRGESWRPDL